MDSYIKLVKKTLETYLQTGKLIDVPPDLPREFFEQRAGVFICFKYKGQLRGCIGTFLPVYENIAQEIINNTISAATEDPRFLPIRQEELQDLKVSIDILSDPVKVPDKEIKSLNPKVNGIMVKSVDGFKSGLLLPDLEGIDTIDQQIEIACQKADLNPAQEKFIVYKFTVKRHEEK
jgi:AmmeMemoRadiSam system protein A